MRKAKSFDFIYHKNFENNENFKVVDEISEEDDDDYDKPLPPLAPVHPSIYQRPPPKQLPEFKLMNSPKFAVVNVIAPVPIEFRDQLMQISIRIPVLSQSILNRYSKKSAGLPTAKAVPVTKEEKKVFRSTSSRPSLKITLARNETPSTTLKVGEISISERVFTSGKLL